MFGGLLGGSKKEKTTVGTSMVIKSKDIDLNKFSEENLILMRNAYPGVCDDILARYLIARNNDFEKASEQYTRAMNYRREYFPILKTSCLKEISTGKLYIRGTDKEGRPLLVFRSRMSFPKERDLEEASRMLIWFAEHVSKRMPANMSKYTLLIDRTEHKSENTDMDLLKHLTGKFAVSPFVSFSSFCV